MVDNGKDWELRIELWNRGYRRSGKGVIFRCHPEAGVRQGKLIYVAKGPPDYVGHLSDGTFVCFDAKQTTRDAFHFDAVKPHQALAFEEVTKMGGAAFLLVRHRAGPKILRMFMLPWPVVSDYYRSHPKGSWDFDDQTIPITEDEGWIPAIQSFPWPKGRSRGEAADGGHAHAESAVRLSLENPVIGRRS